MLQSSLDGDCKTLMFVQISPSDADLGETLCSLNFASRVKGIEYGPARKQADHSELLKYKHMAEKLKHDEKETKKLQDNVQSLQLRLSARDHICRSLQEKVKDLENQLAEARKTRQKQEKRAAAGSRQLRQELKNTTEKKPSLGPSNMRMPLRRLNNYVPPPSPLQTKKSNFSSCIPSFSNGKENVSDGSNIRAAIRGPRRFSAVVRPSSETTTPSLQPKRRVSVAVRPSSESMAPPSLKPRRRVSVTTLRPDPSLHASTPKRKSAILGSTFFRDRARRFSKVWSPVPETRAMTSLSVGGTPMSRSRRFMASPPCPPQQGGAWRPNHPTVALQKKPVVWSPLKMRGKNVRKSIL